MTKFTGLKIWVETFILGVDGACVAGEMEQGGLYLYSRKSGGYTNKTSSFKVGEGGYMKRPPVFLQSGGFWVQ